MQPTQAEAPVGHSLGKHEGEWEATYEQRATSVAAALRSQLKEANDKIKELENSLHLSEVEKEGQRLKFAEKKFDKTS